MKFGQCLVIVSVCAALCPQANADIFDRELIAFLANVFVQKFKDGLHHLAELKPSGRSDGIDRESLRRHFDTIQFCEDFTIGRPMEEPVINSFNSMKKTVFQDVDVLRCVAAMEVIALPHNIVQDFRWALTEVRRQSRSFGVVKQVALLPFALMQTLALLPFRIFKEFIKLSFFFLKAHKSIYFEYI